MVGRVSYGDPLHPGVLGPIDINRMEGPVLVLGHRRVRVLRVGESVPRQGAVAKNSRKEKNCLKKDFF